MVFLHVEHIWGEPALKVCHCNSAVDEPSTWTAYVGKVLSAATSYFPAQVSDMMSQDRAFATVHLLKTNQRNICALAMWVFSGPSGGVHRSLSASE